MRGGRLEEDGAPAEDNGSDGGGPDGRPGGGKGLRPESGMRGEGGAVVPRGAGALVAIYHILCPIQVSNIAASSNLWNKRCLPLRTVDMRALGVAN